MLEKKEIEGPVVDQDTSATPAIEGCDPEGDEGVQEAPKAKPKSNKMGLLKSKPLTRLSIAEGSPSEIALRNATNGLAHSRQSLVPVEGMQQYSQNSGNFFLGGSFFCPPL